MKNKKDLQALEAEYLSLKAENDLAESKLIRVDILQDIVTALTERLDEIPTILAEKYQGVKKEDFEKITNEFKTGFQQMIESMKRTVH